MLRHSQKIYASNFGLCPREKAGDERVVWN